MVYRSLKADRSYRDRDYKTDLFIEEVTYCVGLQQENRFSLSAGLAVCVCLLHAKSLYIMFCSFHFCDFVFLYFGHLFHHFSCVIFFSMRSGFFRLTRLVPSLHCKMRTFEKSRQTEDNQNAKSRSYQNEINKT
jgi:hypothetical protein